MEEHSQAQHFFTKKRVILISLLFLFVIGLITITIIFVIAPGLDINRLANSFQRAFKSDIELSIILLFLLLLYTFIKTVTNIYPILERVKQAKVKIKFSDYLIFGFFYSFISMISPSSLLTDPYAVFWLRTKSISLHKASAISLNNDFLQTAVSIFLCWPSIIYMAVNGTLGSLLNDGDSMDRAVFIFVFVGMGLDVVVLGFLFMFGFSKRIHILVSLVFNKIRKTFKMTHLTKAQIVEKYMKEAVMRQEFLGMLRDFKGSLFIFLVIMGGTFYMYLCLFLSMEMINDDHRYHVSFMHIFSAMNVANSANKFIPSPSGQGTMDLCLIHLLRASDAFSLTSNGIVPANDPYTENLIKGSTLLWRIFTTFLPGIVGIFFGIFEIRNSVKRQKMHHLFLKVKDEKKESIEHDSSTVK